MIVRWLTLTLVLAAVLAGGCFGARDNALDSGPSVAATPATGDHIVVAGGMELPLRVGRSDECPRVAPSGIEVIGPDDSLIQGGARIWWARVSTPTAVCCSEPTLGAVTGVVGDQILLEMRDCTLPDPCACDPPLGSTDAWVSLGELPAGSYRLTADSLERRFTVP